MKIVILTEGNHKQGMGDISGSIALADAFSLKRENFLFISQIDDYPKSWVEDKYTFRFISNRKDLEEAIHQFSPDLVIFNKLNNQVEEIRLVGASNRLVVTIDDVGEAAPLADMRVNPLYKVDDALTGPDYITLSPYFRDRHSQSKEINEKANNLLITQGGADTYGFTPQIIKAIEGLDREVQVNVVLGPAFNHFEELMYAQDNSSLSLKVYHDPENFRELLGEADIAITAGGLTLYELACLGVPALVVCGEIFEEESAQAMQGRGSCIDFGFGENCDYSKLVESVADLLSDIDRRRVMSQAGKETVDGCGVNRIVERIKLKMKEQRILS